MKKHLFLTALVLALVMCFSCGALAADIESGYINDYDIKGLTKVTDKNVTIMTVGQWRTENGITDETVTFFDGGEALNKDDIIIMNEEAAIVLAVGTRNPWGYPSGSVLDAGMVTEDGKAGVRDTTWSIEFLANGWDSWGPANCGEVVFEIVKYDFTAKEEVATGTTAVKVTRAYDLPGTYDTEEYNNDKDFTVVSYYGAPQTGSYLYMFDSITNNMDEDVYYDSYNNYGLEYVCISVTNKGDDGAATFPKAKYYAAGSYANTVGSTEYKDFQGEYLTAVYIADKTFVSEKGNEYAALSTGGKAGYRELHYLPVDAEDNEEYLFKMFEANDSVTYEAYIICSDKADHAAMYDFIYDDVDADPVPVTVKGLEEGTVIVAQDGTNLGWYSIDENNRTINLPVGDYTFKVEKDGYTTSAAKEYTVTGTDDEVELALGTEKVKATVKVVDQNGKPIYARVGVYNGNGTKYADSLFPVVRYCGESVYLSNGTKGEVDVEIPEGVASTLKVMGEGYFFTSNPVAYAIKAEEAVEGAEFTVTVKQDYTIQRGWIGGDVHHHTNKNDAFALPEDIVDSYLASGLDVVSTTDHDYTTNNQRTYNYIANTINADGATDIAGYMPSVEISCSWAHFNVVPLTAESWDYYIDTKATNDPTKDDEGIALAFTNLPYFLKNINDHGASMTANHPWYSYGLFTALEKDAIPGDYTDGYDMIGLNGSYRDQEMSATISTGFDLWDGYADYLNGGDGITDIVGDGEEEQMVKVTRAHYYAGGSDTHDVLTAHATNTAETSDVLRNDREEFYTGKVRSYAAVETTTGENALRDNALAYGQAMINGNSYTTTGPLLTLDKVPGNNASEDPTKQGVPNVNEVNGIFELEVQIDSLSGIRDILVLTSEADGTYKAFAGVDDKTGYNYKRKFVLSHVDENLSIANGIKGEAETDPTLCAVTGKTDVLNEYTFDLKYAPQSNGVNWVAVCVVDIYGNFAVTNAYWVQNTGFIDVPAYKWYADAVFTLSDAGLVKGTDASGDYYKPEEKLTRAGFAQMLFNVANKEQAIDTTKIKDAGFADMKDALWAKDAINYLAEIGVIKGVGNNLVAPNQQITRAEMAVMIYRFSDLEDRFGMAFKDVPKGVWYYDAVMVLGGYDILNGYNETTFGPLDTADRGQAAQIIVNLINYMNPKG